MNKKKIGTAIAITIVIILGVVFVLFKYLIPDEYVPADDEISLHIKLNTNEDIGLLIFDYRADDFESSGGVSNANKSLMKHNSVIVHVWNKKELHSNSDSVELTLRMRVITEYIEPNFENVYPDDITEYVKPISWNAHFGESYFITITGDKKNGYTAVQNGYTN